MLASEDHISFNLQQVLGAERLHLEGDVSVAIGFSLFLVVVEEDFLVIIVGRNNVEEDAILERHESVQVEFGSDHVQVIFLHDTCRFSSGDCWQLFGGEFSLDLKIGGTLRYSWGKLNCQ